MEWGEMVKKAQEGGFATTILPENDYQVAIKGYKYRLSGRNHQLIVTYTVLDGPHSGAEVSDFLTFSDTAGGIAFQKIISLGGDEAFLAQLAANYGNSINEAGVRFIGDTIFRTGLVLTVHAKVSDNGKNNNFYVKSVDGPAVATPAPAPVAPVAPAATPVNPYAAPPVPAANPNLPV